EIELDQQFLDESISSNAKKKRKKNYNKIETEDISQRRANMPSAPQAMSQYTQYGQYPNYNPATRQYNQDQYSSPYSEYQPQYNPTTSQNTQAQYPYSFDSPTSQNTQDPPEKSLQTFHSPLFKNFMRFIE